jgi:putative tryptophan/tyrosine transport system substrate-binding protein
MRRREFVTLLGSAATAWPLAARAQQSAMPLIGFLSSGTADGYASRIDAFRRRLAEAGYVEHQNVDIEYRWAEGQYGRLPGLAADLVGRKVAVLVTIANSLAARAAKDATSTIPIVFVVGADPVGSGIVASLNRTNSNVTGFAMLTVDTATKSLHLLVEMMPKTATIGVLLNPQNPNVGKYKSDVAATATALGRKLVIKEAANDREIDAAIAELAGNGIEALFVGSDTLFNSEPNRLATLTLRHKLPAIFAYANFVEAGGLMSYGPDPNEGYRGIAAYTARILKGEKPADLPVQETTKFQLTVNIKTAKLFGLDVPPSLLAITDEVIE